MIALSVWMSPRWRWLNATSSTRLAPRAASTIAVASALLRAIGFSDSTCRPFSSAATAIGACRNVGTATLTTSRSSPESNSSQRATWRPTPCRSASAVRTSSSSPAMPASSTSGWAAYALACWCPAQPTPITPARSVGLLVMDDHGTSHGLGRKHPRTPRARGARDLSPRHARHDRDGAGLAARRSSQRPHSHPRPARARSDRAGAGADRRAHVVGSRRPRRGRRRDRGARARRRARRHGPAGTALRPLREDLQAPAGHLLQPPLAQRRRTRAGVERRALAPHRGRGPAPHRARRARDVRRALRHPGPGRARVRLLLRGRRGVPRRLLLHPRRGPDLLLQPRRPGIPGLSPPGHPAGARERGAVDRAPYARPRPGRPRVPARLASDRGPTAFRNRP